MPEDRRNVWPPQKRRELDIVASLEAQGVITHEQAEAAKDRINRAYGKKAIEGVRRFGSTQTNQLLDIYEAWKNFFDSTEEDGGNWATRLAALASSVFAVMTAGMQQYSEFVKACSDLEVAKAEKKYDREIELAEGNSYRVKKAEKQKEKEIAKIKKEANRKMFVMQVIQAVAQTATNALNAYGSAAAVPVIGYILAPIAAAMAVAAGAIQIATIKKQQQASEAQGYAEGGFTLPDARTSLSAWSMPANGSPRRSSSTIRRPAPCWKPSTTPSAQTPSDRSPQPMCRAPSPHRWCLPRSHRRPRRERQRAAASRARRR